MKSEIKQIATFLILINCQCSSAQEITSSDIWHYKSQLFLLKKDGYYLVEGLYSPLKYSQAYIDTLFPSNNKSDSFIGKTYFLYFENNQPKLINKNHKKGIVKIKPANDKELQERNRKYNNFYYMPYEIKISRYSRSLSEKNRDKYEAFNEDRNEMYKKLNELNIEAFKQYFDEFIKKYDIK
jgi:hypothetical protein